MITNNETGVRLLIITPTLQCGGSEKFVSLICNHINTGKFLVCLVVVNNTKPFYNIKNPAIKIIDLKKKRVLFSLPAIKKVVNSFKPDIIFSTANHLNLYLAIFKNNFDATIKFVAREASIVSINSRQAKMPALYSWLIKKYYSRFSCIICQSVYMQQDLVCKYQIPTSKTIVINNATQTIDTSPVKTKAKDNNYTHTFITVARLSQEKGIERLIHAVGLLIIPFKYYIIGEGKKREELQKLIAELQLQDKVFLKGQKAHPFEQIKEADLFLMGSYYEGFPNVLLEAGAHGIPVVAFNVPGGIAEIITPENGVMVDDNDIIGFAKAINNALLLNLNNNSIIDLTKKRFSVNRMINEIESVFLKVASDN
jgi:glycosyltransferase involved in cell wall biosynthesis